MYDAYSKVSVVDEYVYCYLFYILIRFFTLDKRIKISDELSVQAMFKVLKN
jgi:hypothetical protein